MNKQSKINYTFFSVYLHKSVQKAELTSSTDTKVNVLLLARELGNS